MALGTAGRASLRLGLRPGEALRTPGRLAAVLPAAGGVVRPTVGVTASAGTPPVGAVGLAPAPQTGRPRPTPPACRSEAARGRALRPAFPALGGRRPLLAVRVRCV